MKKHLFTFLFVASAICSIAQEQITTLFEREADFERFSGTVLIVNKGNVLLHNSYGYADNKNSVKNTVETPFDIGSVSKQFTAAAILSLVHDQRIDLNTPINNYLGPYGSKKWKHITVHHLLTHTSGIPSLFQSNNGTDDIFPSASPIEIDKLVNSFRSKKLKFKPGKQYSYSNSGYLLLALIIENVSGQRYGEYLQNELYDKYDLTNTSFGPKGNEFAKPHFNYHADMTEEGTVFHQNWMLGAGGIYSTASDLYKWTQVIQNDTFLNEELGRVYLNGHVKTQRGKYAYGWDVAKSKEGTIISHDGTNMGYVSYCGFNIDNGDAVIITTNQTYSTFETVGRSEEYIQHLVNKTWKNINGDLINTLPQLAQNEPDIGTYTFEDGYQIQITKDDEKHYVTGIGDYSPARMAFQHALSNTDSTSQRVIQMANAFKTKKFKGIKPICDKQMQFAVKTGIIKLGFGLITKHLGTISKITPYYAENGLGKVRLYGENGVMDIKIYLNEKNEVQGIFEGGSYSKNGTLTLKLHGVDKEQFLIDGFPYGEEDALITMSEKELVIEQLGRRFKAQKEQPIAQKK